MEQSKGNVEIFHSKSFQTCKVVENEEKLKGLLDFYTKKKARLKVQVIETLLFILRQLLAESSSTDTRGKGFLHFEEAYGLFISFFDKHITKQQFRDYILNEEYGLRVCIIATIHSTRYEFYIYKNFTYIRKILVWLRSQGVHY